MTPGNSVDTIQETVFTRGMEATERLAVIVKDPEFDHFKRVERRQWRADLYGVPGFRRKYLPTRRALVEWCEEFGFKVVDHFPEA